MLSEEGAASNLVGDSATLHSDNATLHIEMQASSNNTGHDVELPDEGPVSKKRSPNRYSIFGDESAAIKNGSLISAGRIIKSHIARINIIPSTMGSDKRGPIIENTSSGSIIQSESIASVEVTDKTNELRKDAVRAVLDTITIGLFMTLCTIVALFLTDLNGLYGTRNSDPVVSNCMLVLFIIFTVELSLESWVREKYFNSMFFYLDLLAILTMLNDIDYFSSGLGLPRSALTARAGRVGRIVRIVRIVRLTRIGKLAKYPTRIYRYFAPAKVTEVPDATTEKVPPSGTEAVDTSPHSVAPSLSDDAIEADISDADSTYERSSNVLIPDASEVDHG